MFRKPDYSTLFSFFPQYSQVTSTVFSIQSSMQNIIKNSDSRSKWFCSVSVKISTPDYVLPHSVRNMACRELQANVRTLGFSRYLHAASEVMRADLAYFGARSIKGDLDHRPICIRWILPDQNIMTPCLVHFECWSEFIQPSIVIFSFKAKDTPKFGLPIMSCT